MLFSLPATSLNRRPKAVRRDRAGVLIASLLFASATLVCDDSAAASRSGEAPRQYTFAWQFQDSSQLAPRGGTTRGTPVDLVNTPTDAWVRLRAEGLSKKERDRRAILAMAGPYRTSFDFIETVGFSAGYEPPGPYQSWGTEYVYVVSDEPDFISLQHIMVMRILGDDGAASEPLVMKHWRQDWHYQATVMHTFQGERTWAREELTPADAEGRWMQAVYQVDDSPRYMAAGHWAHYANHSSWTSDETWRPLPRRESSVRDDYDVMVGTNRHTITPTGWVQEEDNLKVVLDDRGRPDSVLARETGLARYERIDNFGWEAGDAYWNRTGPFWAVVRERWDSLFAEHERLGISKSAQGVPMFAEMFQLAETTTAKGFDAEATRATVEKALADYLLAR